MARPRALPEDPARLSLRVGAECTPVWFAPGDVSDKEHERLLGEEDGEHSSAADVWDADRLRLRRHV